MRKTDVRLRFLSLIIALILFITQTLTITAFAEGATPTAEQYFTFDSSTGTITAYNNAGGSDVVIPSTIGGVAVKKLRNTFYLNSQINSVVIPEGVTDIGYNTFGCSSLSSLVIPISVKTIGMQAFAICASLQNVTINSSGMSIDINAFEYSGSAIEGLKGAYEAGGVGNYVLNGSTWTHYIVTDGLKYQVLAEPSGGVNGTVMLVANSYAGTSYTVPAMLENHGRKYNVTSIGNNAFNNRSQLINIFLPDSLTSIGASAFAYCKNLTGITIPNGVTAIGSDAFNDCENLTTIVIPHGVTSIESCTFCNCGKLKNVTMPNNLTAIGREAFELCTGLTNVTIPVQVTAIGESAFRQCTGLTGVTIPDKVTSIGSHAFADCTGLTGISVPDKVTSIGSYAFADCTGLASVSMPYGVTSIGESSFAGCTKLASVKIPNGVKTINWNTFDSCKSLTSVSMPEGVTAIKTQAFGTCSSLTSITIPGSVTSIENFTFLYCKNLNCITFSGSKPPAFGTSGVFMNVPEGLRVIVPSGAVADYKNISNVFPNSTIIEEYPGTLPIIDNVLVNPPSTTVAKGGSISFLVSVEGSNNPPQTVTWSISGNSSNNTQINDSGLLRVASDEKADSITVTATSTADTTKYGIATVTIYSIKNKILKSITPCAAITNVANETSKTASALGLPSTVELVTDNGNVQAHVDWNVSGSTYDPSVATQQTFVVDGNVTLPSRVVNPTSVVLTTHVGVTVNAASGGNTGNKTITGFIVDSATKTAPYGTDFALLDLPDKLKAVGSEISGLWVKVTKWVCSTYNSTVPGTYTATAVLDSGYVGSEYVDSGFVLGSGVSAPQIKVTVAAKENPANNGGSNHHNSNNSGSKTPAAPTAAADIPTGTAADLSGVTLPSGVTGVNLNVTKKEPSIKSEQQAVNFSRALLANPKAGVIGNPVIYDMELLDQNGSVTSGTGKIKISLPAPVGLRGTPHMFRYEESTGTFTDMGAKVENGMLVFETDRLGYFAAAGMGDSISVDTTSYTMPVNGQYQISLKLTGAKAASVRFRSSNDKAVKVVQLKNGNYQVAGVSTGIAYIMFDVYDNKNKLLSHASVRVTVQNGVKPNGNSARQIGIY